MSSARWTQSWSACAKAGDSSTSARARRAASAGSTRLKAGTAQKLVLNMISTATMIRLGYVTGNRMTNLQPRNVKLRARSLRILRAEAGLGEREAREALESAGGDLRVALVMSKTGRSREEARAALEAAGWVVARAVEELSGPD